MATAVAAAVVAGAVAPAGASAVEVRIKDNADGALSLTQGVNPTVRHLAEELGLGFTADEAKLKVSAEVMFGDANVLELPINCRDVAGFPTLPRPIQYRGNGVYTVNVRLYAENSTCGSNPVKQASFQYTVNAFTGVGAPPGTLLTRKPGDPINIEYRVPVGLNPGAKWLHHEVHYSLNAQLDPNSGLVPAGKVVFPDDGTDTARVRFEQPGSYLFAARVKSPVGGVFAPWSQPVTMKVVAPFDLKSRFLTWTDSRGPSYRVKVNVVEPGARGKVTFSLARGKKRGRYRRIGTARISRRGTISKRFTVRRTGRYRLRISYKGNDLVTGGHVTFPVQFKRRIIFRSSASSVG